MLLEKGSLAMLALFIQNLRVRCSANFVTIFPVAFLQRDGVLANKRSRVLVSAVNIRITADAKMARTAVPYNTNAIVRNLLYCGGK